MTALFAGVLPSSGECAKAAVLQIPIYAASITLFIGVPFMAFSHATEKIQRQ